VRDRASALASAFFAKLKFHKLAKHCGACGSKVRDLSEIAPETSEIPPFADTAFLPLPLIAARLLRPIRGGEKQCE
jgi:hypothetical protein